MSKLSSPSDIDFVSSLGHPGTVVGLVDGIYDGAIVGSSDVLGATVGKVEGKLEGDSVRASDGIEEGYDVDGTDEGSADGK